MLSHSLSPPFFPSLHLIYSKQLLPDSSAGQERGAGRGLGVTVTARPLVEFFSVLIVQFLNIEIVLEEITFYFYFIHFFGNQ